MYIISLLCIIKRVLFDSTIYYNIILSDIDAVYSTCFRDWFLCKCFYSTYVTCILFRPIGRNTNTPHHEYYVQISFVVYAIVKINTIYSGRLTVFAVTPTIYVVIIIIFISHRYF